MYLRVFVAFILLIHLSSCQENSLDPSESLSQSEWKSLPKTIVTDSNYHDTLQLIKSSTDFPLQFYTYHPKRIVVYPVLEGAEAIVFNEGKAKLTFMVLPQEFKSTNQVKNYAKDILQRGFNGSETTETGYLARNLEKTQRIDIGKYDGRYYFWLEDLPFAIDELGVSPFQSVRDNFRFVKTLD